MKEIPFGSERFASNAESSQGKITKLEKGEFTAPENERIFHAEEVLAAIKELEKEAGDLKITNQLVSQEGVLLMLGARTPGSASGYEYILKGTYGAHGSSMVTKVDRIDFDGPDSEEVIFGEVIAEYIDNNWKRQ
jgi:hypothetical protein